MWTSGQLLGHLVHSLKSTPGGQPGPFKHSDVSGDVISVCGLNVIR